MVEKDRILLIDFSKVLSPIGISNYLSERFSESLMLSKEEIWYMYKKGIGPLLKGECSISMFIYEVEPYLKDGRSKDDLFEVSKKIPPLDMDFLEGLQKLRENYYVYIASDIYEILGEMIKKRLEKYFDGFIFSYEEKARKCEDIFLGKLTEKDRFF